MSTSLSRRSFLYIVGGALVSGCGGPSSPFRQWVHEHRWYTANETVAVLGPYRYPAADRFDGVRDAASRAGYSPTADPATGLVRVMAHYVRHHRRLDQPTQISVSLFRDGWIEITAQGELIEIRPDGFVCPDEITWEIATLGSRIIEVLGRPDYFTGRIIARDAWRVVPEMPAAGSITPPPSSLAIDDSRWPTMSPTRLASLRLMDSTDPPPR